MNSDSPHRTFLQHQLQILQSISSTLQAAIAAVAQRNLAAMEQHNEGLSKLCRQLASVQFDPSRHSETNEDLLRQLANERIEVRRLNGVFQTVVRRSSRNVKTLLNIISPALGESGFSAHV